jgi:hypothetical protein
MAETVEISQQLSSLIEASEALGYSKGRSSVRAEILQLIQNSYDDADDGAKEAYTSILKFMLDSFTRDVPNGEA